jgi:hypothetical protein
LILFIKLTLDLLREIAIGKSYSQFLRVDKASSCDVNLGVSFRWSTSGENVVDSNRSIKEDRIIICIHVSEDSVVCVGLNHFWKVKNCV